jgi:hypothetical protein
VMAGACFGDWILGSPPPTFSRASRESLGRRWPVMSTLRMGVYGYYPFLPYPYLCFSG